MLRQSVSIAGVDEERRGLRRTLVVCRTLDRRGKSFTPASSVDIEESRSESVSRSEDTQPSNECAMSSAFPNAQL